MHIDPTMRTIASPRYASEGQTEHPMPPLVVLPARAERPVRESPPMTDTDLHYVHTSTRRRTSGPWSSPATATQAAAP